MLRLDRSFIQPVNIANIKHLYVTMKNRNHHFLELEGDPVHYAKH